MIPWYLFKFYAQRHAKFTASCGVLLILNVFMYSYLHLFFILWAFIGGMVIAYAFLDSDTVLPNVLALYSHKAKSTTEDDELTLMKTVCTVCGLKKCPRHRPELNILAFQPWTNLDIHQSVDQALDEFFTIVLKDYVYTWYRDLSEDEEFVDELRTNFRFLASVTLRRMKKIDVPKFATQKLLLAGMKHVDLSLQAYRNAGQDGDLQQSVFQELGPMMHCAMWNRKSELEYLRRLLEGLFPYILRPQALNSKSTSALVRELLAGSILLPALDALANPDMINNLLLVFFDNTPPPPATEPPSPLVPFLGQFSQARAHNQSCLRLELKDLINCESPESLFPFMQFLKSEAAVNVLQFCLQCEDLNRRILSPDVSQSEFVQLHMKTRDLYESYCAPNALDRIKFDEDIVQALREVVEGPPDQVIRLRTSTPLFKAYEHAYNLLENNFLPMFHQSDDYYSLICGGRPNSMLSRQLSRVPKKKDFTLAQFSNKLKDVFRSADEVMDGEEATNNMTSSMSMEEELLEEEELADGDHSMHDLSSWRVTIPRIGARPDPENPRKQFFVFIVDVRRLDLKEGDNEQTQWTVARRYPEFYVLEQKLTEFHGEFSDCQLPSKKSFGTKKQNFMEEKKNDLEAYLQKLLTKPQLVHSELLYKFLTSEHEFSSSFLPDIKLGKFVKTKLVKEKGQHLEEFLTNFLISTEAPKPRASKMTRTGSEASLMSTESEKLLGTIFENNLNVATPSSREQSDGVQLKAKNIEGFFDSLVYVVKDVFSCPHWVHHMLMSCRILLKSTLEDFLDSHLEHKFCQLTQEHRLVSLIHLLRDNLFFDKDLPRSEEDKQERYKQALGEFIKFIPGPLASALGSENTERGCQLLLQVFQQPKLNKQLSYVMLDILVCELFPELTQASPQQQGEES